MMLLLGILIGIFLSAVALVLDATKSKRPKVWIDENYQVHLVKKRRK